MNYQLFLPQCRYHKVRNYCDYITVITQLAEYSRLIKQIQKITNKQEVIAMINYGATGYVIVKTKRRYQVVKVIDKIINRYRFAANTTLIKFGDAVLVNYLIKQSPNITRRFK